MYIILNQNNEIVSDIILFGNEVIETLDKLREKKTSDKYYVYKLQLITLQTQLEFK